MPIRFSAALIPLFFAPAAFSAEVQSETQAFVAKHCADCHTGDYAEAGLDFDALTADLSDPATFAKWERVFDRVESGEMPPPEMGELSPAEVREALEPLSVRLVEAHAAVRETALRRLNRIEYQNTLNDTFGTNLDFSGLLPEDGRSHEFDTVGEALSISATHMERYIDAAKQVWDASVVRTSKAPAAKPITASYADTREGKKFIGDKWRKLSDGAVARFDSGGYPSGMMRGTEPKLPGRHKVTIRGYGFQSKGQPITFSVNGTSFARGSESPVYGYFTFPAGKPGDAYEVSFEADIADRYMIQIEPHGVSKGYYKGPIDKWDGPGLAILDVTLERLPDQWPKPGHELIFGNIERREIPPGNPNDRKKSWYQPKFECVFANEQEAATAAAGSLGRVAKTMFRRPVRWEELEPYYNLYESERAGGADFESALKVAFTAILCSPRFLFLEEPATAEGAIDQYALASRLSYFLTRTSPDEELLRTAEEGRLADPATLREQTERLLNDPRHGRFLTDFADSWLDLREMDFTAPDGQLFPEFDPYLRWSMPRETTAFLEKLIGEDRPIRDLVAPDYAMLNERLAQLYEIDGVAGPEIREVQLPRSGPGSVRGGLLAQGAVLKVTANGTNSSPVVRGVWVLERILGTPPSPPPPGIPGVEPDTRGASTLRELLAAHRENGDCQSCHKKIDPPGFAMEEFNPIGGLRDRYRSLGEGEKVNKKIGVGPRDVRYKLGPPVDSSGELPDGRKFRDFKEFQKMLAEDEDQLARTLAEKLLVFGTGRELGFSDRAVVEEIVAQSGQSGHSVRELLHLCVQSQVFRGK